MAKGALLALFTLGLVAPEGNAEKRLNEAKFPLNESLDKAGKDLKDVTAVSTWLREVKGRTLYTVRFARGKETQKVTLDAKTGETVETVTEKRDRTATLALSKTSVAQAIEIALKKVPGKAYRATLVREGKKRAIYEVIVLSGGKRNEVEVNAATGEIIEVEQDDDDDDDQDDDDDDEDDEDDDDEDDDEDDD
jgi:uncharacterized membrane protein YkoI